MLLVNRQGTVFVPSVKSEGGGLFRLHNNALKGLK